MTSTVRQPTHPPPAGYTLLAIDSGGLELRGWLGRGVGAPTTRPSVVVVHGFGDSLESYDSVADIFRRRGQAVLLLDLRGHGGSAGNVTTLGDHERDDVRAGMARLRAEGLAGEGIVLVGYSLGATACLLAAADVPDVRAVIVESPFDTLRETVAHHGELLYHLPRWTPLTPLSIRFAEIYARFDADRIDAVAAARRIRAPLLAIADANDPRMPERVVRRIYDAHPGPKEIWIVPGRDHVEARADPRYEQRLTAFLTTHGL